MLVEVVPHNPQWKQMFLVESTRLTRAIADNLAKIHHIGSTAVPGIYAKPIIDLLIEVIEVFALGFFGAIASRLLSVKIAIYVSNLSYLNHKSDQKQS